MQRINNYCQMRLQGKVARTFEGSVEAEDAELRKYEHLTGKSMERVAAAQVDCRRAAPQRTNALSPAERQMNGDCVCCVYVPCCEMRVAASEHNVCLAAADAARVASWQQRRLNITQVFPSLRRRCRSRRLSLPFLHLLEWQTRISRSRSLVRWLESRTPSRIITQTLECVHGDLRVVLGVGRQRKPHREHTMPPYHFITSRLALVDSNGLSFLLNTYREIYCARAQNKDAFGLRKTTFLAN